MIWLLRVNETSKREIPLYFECIDENEEGGWCLLIGLRKYAMEFENKLEAEEFKEYYDHFDTLEVISEWISE